MAGIRSLITPALVIPNDFVVKVGRDANFYSVTVGVNPIDMPRLIGKAGNNVRAIKAILAHVGQRNRCFIRFYAADPDNPTATRHVTPPAPKWESGPLMKAARTALTMAGYSDRLTGPDAIEEKQFITATAVLDPTFGEALARWLHVIGRNYGANVIFVHERHPAA